MWMGRKNRISENKYHLLVEQASDGIVITDAEGHYLEVNNKMCQITGYSRDELLEMYAQDIIHPDDLNTYPIQWDEAKAGKAIRADRRLIRKSGETVYTEISAGMLDDGTFMGIIRDITERKLNEDRRRESEEKYRLLFEYANDAIFIVDIETSHIIDANRNAAKHLGYTREELLNLRLKDVELPMPSGELRVIKNQLSSTGMLIFEQDYRRKDGSALPVEISSRVIDFEGRKVMLNFARDITQRKEAEETERDLRILAEALRDTAASLSSTLDVNEVVNRVLENVVRVVPCDTANVMLIEGGTARVAAQRGYEQFGVKEAFQQLQLTVVETPNLNRMVETQSAYIVPDIAEQKEWVVMDWATWIRSTVGAPIMAEGQVIGFIHLDSVLPHAFNQTHAERLQAFANQASLAIQNARRYQTAQNYASELEQQVAQRTAELTEANTFLREQIAERQKVEKALAEERNLLRTLIDNLPNQIYVKDNQSRFIIANVALAQFHGEETPDAILGKTDHDYFPTYKARYYFESEQQLLQSGEKLLNQEELTTDGAGNKRWVIGTKVPLHDSQGSITGLVGINHDVTDLKRAQEQLSEERNLLRTVIDNLPDSIYAKDTDGRFTLANKSVLPRLALNSMEDLIGKTDFDLFATHRAADFYDAEQRLFRTGQPIHNVEGSYKDKATGEEKWESGSKIPLFDGDGHITGLVGINRDITEQKRAEKKLAEERNLLRTVIDNLPDLVYVKDMEHRYLLGNKALLRYSRVKDESELIGKTILDMPQTPEVREQNRVAEQEVEVLKGTAIVNREYYWTDENRVERWFVVNKIPLRDHLGRIIGLVGINREITERKRAQQTLAEERNLLRTVIDNLPDLVYVKDRNSHFMLGNKALLRFFDVAEEKDLIGKTSLDFRAPEEESDLAVIDTEEGRVLNGEPQAQYEFYYVDGSRTPRWFNVTKLPLCDREGRIIGLVGINRDVSEQKRAQKTLAEERNLLRTVIDNLPDLVYVKDLESRFVMVNNAVVKRVGMSRIDQVIGKTDFDFSQLANANKFREEELEIFQTGIPMLNREYPAVDDTGNNRWNLVTKVPLRDSQGSIIGLVGINHDITDLKRAEEQLVQIFNSARCLMWYAIVDEKGGKFKWNFHISNEEAAQRFLPVKMSPGQSYTDAWRESRFPKDREKIKKNSKEALHSGKLSYTQEYRCRCADGQVRWLSEDVVVKPLLPGRWSLVGICTDVTERKIAEEVLQRANAELEQRVTERTAELSQANTALRASQAELQAKTESLTTINTIADTVYRSLDLQTVVERALDSIMGYAQVTAAGIMMLDEQAQVLRLLSSRGFSRAALATGSILPLRGSLSGIAVACKDIITSQNINVDDRVKSDVRQALVGQGLRSAVIVPLIFQDHVMGTLNLVYTDHRGLTVQERETLSSIGKSIGIAMANAQYVAQIQAEVAERKRAEEAERSQRLLAEALRDTAAELSGTLDLSNVMDCVLTNVARVLPHDAANILFIENGQARVVRHVGYEKQFVLRLDLNHLVDLREMAQQGRPRVIADTRAYRDWSNRPEVAWIRSNVAAPIRSSGAVIGFLMLDSREPNAFNEMHAQQLQAFANQAGIAIDNARLYDTIQRHASELEQRVRERTAELERERAQLSAILNALGEGVTGLIEQQRFANKALSELTGYTAENFDNRLFQSEGITDDDYRVFLQQIDEHVDARGVWKGELKLCHREGGIIDVAVTVSGVKGRDGEPVGTVMVIRDISQEKILAEQKARFIANASHELRTPLANIKTRLYLIQRQPEKIEEHLQIMELVANRMRSLIEDMLDVSRFERGMISLDPTELVLQTVVNDVLSVQQPEAELKQIRLTTNMPEEPLYVRADSKRITQVITNLVTNAINYTPEGGTIIVSAAAEDDNSEGYMVLRVQDSGIGISEEHLPHVFNPFFRASEHTTGTGLGLTIAKEIVELHHGHITVESEIGSGSSFSVHLPLIQSSN